MPKLFWIIIIVGVVLIAGAVAVFYWQPWEQPQFGTSSSEPQEVVYGRGNTTSNSMNLGFAAQEGDWIYFVGPSHALYKMRLDATESQQINIQIGANQAEPIFESINVIGGWIYFANRGEDWSKRIYRVNIDGTGLERLSDDIVSDLVVIDGWIYYNKAYDWPTNMYALYRMRVDRSSREKLADIRRTGWGLNIIDDWIFFADTDEDSAWGSLYKVRTDGTELTLIKEIEAGQNIFYDGWVYFTVEGPIFGIHRVRVDGSGYEQISYDRVRTLNISEGWIFYNSGLGGGENLYRIRLDGTDREPLSAAEADSMVSINIAGDWVFYSTERFRLSPSYRIRTDGTGHEALR